MLNLSPHERARGRERAIDHIGIAVNSLDEAIPFWTSVLRTSTVRREKVEWEGAEVAFLGDAAPLVELLAPLADETPVGRFLMKRGPGLHHICLAVADIRQALAEAQAAGAEILQPAIRKGALGHSIAFLDPRSADGVLLELRELA